MRIMLVSAEVAPFAKAGGLADVAAALPRALHDLGVDARVVMPKYRGVEEKSALCEVCRFSVPVNGVDVEAIVYQGLFPNSDIPVYFLGNDYYFDRAEIYGEGGGDYPDALDRFVFLSRGALLLCERLSWQPNVIHANDWHTALIPAYLRSGIGPRDSGNVLTIHNLAYQGSFAWDRAAVTGLDSTMAESFHRGDSINLLQGGIVQADLLTTVSPSYASEVLVSGNGLEEALCSRRDDLAGIVNGADYGDWNPNTDEHIWANYSADLPAGKEENKARLLAELKLAPGERAPLVGMISRLVNQKGFDLVMAAFDRMLTLGIRFILLGTGDPKLEEFFSRAAERFPSQVASLVTFSEEWAHRIEAASDIFLMPSLFEPCGLNQLYSLRYGTVPVVRATGGLRDTVFEHHKERTSGNGFLFSDYTPEAMLGALRRAVTLYRDDPEEWGALRERGMREDHSWSVSARSYLSLYERLG